MIAIPSGASIYLCTTVTDMRKSFDGLSGLIRSEFQREPNDGSLFLFINRRRDRIKILLSGISLQSMKRRKRFVA